MDDASGGDTLTFCNHIAVDETVRYTPHPNDPGKTLLQQEAVVTVSGVPLTHYMEELLTSKICFNSGMGRQAMEWVIEKLHLEEFDDLLTQTVRQFDDLTSKTRRGMDDLQSAIKSFDEIHNLTNDDDDDNDDEDDDDEDDEDDNDDSDDDEDEYEDDEVEGEGEREVDRICEKKRKKKIRKITCNPNTQPRR
ncbi:protein slowmo [Vespula maculifrons]|uniref:Protein slowmo n=1 Tax=Vespula maculifrons TaxID=7453 RepID=A0ABD2CWC9_VESMC